MGRYLAIDHGSKRIGLALSDPMKIIAKPFRTITYDNLDDFFNILFKIIKEEEVECIILGFPIGMNGQETIQTKHVLEFQKKIKLKINIPILLQDERLSSLSAEKSLIEQKIKTGYNKSEIDKTAAAIFLQQFLDTNRL
jgi:putative Holliday junction resolvase|tara:strand:- start:9105 stop:9521 length:417 start_codon:yes stop_codon:yes gene_type:complete